MNEAVYNAYYKGFEECKRKVMLAFHLPNLKDIITDDLEEIKEGKVSIALGDAIEAIKISEFEVDPGPPQAPPSIAFIGASCQMTSIREMVVQVMA